jgi:hypothetical protein
MIRSLRIIAIIAGGHFAASFAVVAITAEVASRLGAQDAAGSFWMHALVAVTRGLHFPIISLGWYSRQWFPGPWIAVPMAINSLLWGGLGLVVVKILKGIGGRTR